VTILSEVGERRFDRCVVGMGTPQIRERVNDHLGAAILEQQALA
jgi:hypothetical protein